MITPEVARTMALAYAGLENKIDESLVSAVVLDVWPCNVEYDPHASIAGAALLKKYRDAGWVVDVLVPPRGYPCRDDPARLVFQKP